MDPASAIIGIVSSGFTVFRKVNEIRKVIKGAPAQLQSLETSSNLIIFYLKRLQGAEVSGLSHPDAAHIVELCDTARQYLDDVKTIMDKVTVSGGSAQDERARGRINKLNLWRKNADIVDIARKLTELQGTLASIAIMVQLEALGSTEIERSNVVRDHPPVDTTGHCIQAKSSYSSREPLGCLSNCACRCHHPSIVQLIPGWLAPYTGQVSISKRLLHPTFSSWLSLCNAQTCRGDLRRSMSLRWNSPLGLLHGSLQYIARDRQINFSIGAPRIVLWYSHIVNAVCYGDLQGVRNQFATGKASIWDYTMDGLPVFRYACYWWQRDPTEQRLEIIRFFTEAGAEAVLLEETESAYSAHDELTIGFFTYLLRETSDAGQSLATVVRTNTAAIQIFRSILNMDPVDALEDYLDRQRAQSMDVTGFMASLEDTTCNSESRSSVFKAINYTPLGYAISFSPESVESLLADGEDAAAEPTLVYAVSCGRPKLIKPLLDAGADINMRNRWGHTALLVACSRCYYDEFLELLQWAEDEIDWNACAPDGRNALELFDSAARAGGAANLSQSKIDKFRAELVAHMKFVADESEGQLDMPGAFPDVPYM